MWLSVRFPVMHCFNFFCLYCHVVLLRGLNITKWYYFHGLLYCFKLHHVSAVVTGLGITTVAGSGGSMITF